MGHSDARAAAEEVDGTIDGFMWAGYNIQEIWPKDESTRGDADEYATWYERADLKGWPITGVLEDFSGYADTWSDPQTQQRYRSAAAAQMKRFRNHPSIIIWNTSPNRQPRGGMERAGGMDGSSLRQASGRH
jgi:beta-galactosidase